MNTFIILIHEEYDQYEIEHAYPYITANSKEIIEQWMKDLAEVALDYQLKYIKNTHFQEPKLNIGQYKIHFLQLITYDGKYIINPPKVLELKEWLLKENINNNERPQL